MNGIFGIDAIYNTEGLAEEHRRLLLVLPGYTSNDIFIDHIPDLTSLDQIKEKYGNNPKVCLAYIHQVLDEPPHIQTTLKSCIM